MPDIRIHRDHSLGLAKAREVAWQWAEQVEQQFDMECTVLEGDFSDTVAFTRSGVKGTLTVAADHFDLHAQLGFLLGAFSKTIEGEIQKNLDALLGQAGAAGKAAAKAAGKTAAKADGKSAGKSAAQPAAQPAAKAAAKSPKAGKAKG